MERHPRVGPVLDVVTVGQQDVSKIGNQRVDDPDAVRHASGDEPVERRVNLVGGRRLHDHAAVEQRERNARREREHPIDVADLAVSAVPSQRSVGADKALVRGSNEFLFAPHAASAAEIDGGERVSRAWCSIRPGARTSRKVVRWILRSRRALRWCSPSPRSRDA